MKRADELAREVDVLRERLFRLSEANVRINESLDFDTVLQGILDSARSLTGARFGLLVLADESGREQDLLVSGLAAHEHQRFMEWFKAEEVLFECLNRIPGPLRGKDFNSDAKAAGFPAFRPPVESVKCPMAYLTAPILHRGASVRYTRHPLATAGYAPIVTGDPGDVPRIIRAKNPRLVLLDLMLPGSNGIELMGRILNITDVPVVFMSAYAQDDVIARALDTGAVDYIVKPFSPTELVARIRAALRERSALHHGDLPEPYVFAELTVDFAERRVTLSGQPVRLTSTETSCSPNSRGTPDGSLPTINCCGGSGKSQASSTCGRCAQLSRACGGSDVRFRCKTRADVGSGNYTETDPIGIAVHEVRVATRAPNS